MPESKILIVEDEWIIANDIKKSLLNLGYDISSIVSTGEDAIKNAEENRPDLVLMDIVLQGEINGMEAADMIISRLEIPVIYLTAYTDEEILRQAKKTRAFGYLVKPFNDRELQATIELAIYKHSMEKKLRESQSRLLITLKSISDAVISTDSDGSIVFMNPVAQDLTGLSFHDVKGTALHDVFNIKSTEKKKYADNPVKKILTDGKILTQEKFVLTTGKGQINIELSSAPITDDKKRLNGVVIVFHDITERVSKENVLDNYRKELEQLAEERTVELKQSEEKYSSLFHNSSDAILIHDSSGNILDVNKKVLEQCGYSENEIFSLKVSDLFPSEEMGKSEAVCNNIARNGVLNFEINLKNKNGTVFPAEVSSALLDIGGHKVIQCIFRDISERKKVEHELTKHREQLEEMIKERTFELLEANQNLKVEINVRKQVEKKLLSYQKQLQSLTSQISLIEEREKRRIATELHDSIGQTLALSKIKLGQLNKSAKTAELKNIIKEILNLIELTIKGTRALTFELSPPVLYELGLAPAVQWLVDQFREKHGLNIVLERDVQEIPFDNNTRFVLFQAVRELLVNIVKHSQAKKVEVSMFQDNNKLMIVIEDDGIGFSEMTAASGYGIFNIRERINHLNGHFEIKSGPGHGTRVMIVAPFSRA